MLPDEYREFFIASAGAAAALIGLLFVAVSVFPDQARQATTRVQFQSRASAALLVFTNALVISLSALVPGVSLGWWATAAATSVLLFAAGAARALAGDAHGKANRRESLWLFLGLLLIGGFEMSAGIRLIRGAESRCGPDAELRDHRRPRLRNLAGMAAGRTPRHGLVGLAAVDHGPQLVPQRCQTRLGRSLTAYR